MLKKLTLFACSALVASHAFSADNNKQLETVLVEGKQENTKISTGSRLNLDMMEIPATVNIINGDAIRERQDFTVIEAVTRSAGFSSEATPGNGGQSIAARGFRGQGAVTKLYDGTSYFNAYGTITSPFDTWGVERIEVLKGPASVLYGEGGIGGAINVIPKKPSQQQSGALRATSGQNNTGFIGLSLNGGLTETLAARVDYSSYQSDGWVDNGDTETDALAVALLWEATDDLDITLRYDSSDQKPMLYSGTATKNGGFIKGLEYSNFQISDSKIRYQDESIRLKADWTISSEMSLQTELYHLESDRFWKVIENFSADDADDDSGPIKRGGPALLAHDLSQDGLRTNLNFANEVGTIRMTSSVGFEFNTVSFVRPFNFGSANGDAAAITIDPKNFNPGLYSDVTSDTELGNKRVSADLDQYALFAESQLELTEQLSFVLGLRYENFTTDFETTGSGNFDQSQDALTSRMGAVFDINDATAVYAQHSTGASHPTTNLLTARKSNKEADFIKTEQLELGIKQNLLDGRIQWALAYFDITRNNLTDDDPTSDDPTVKIDIPEQTSEGFEFSISSNLSNSLQVYANASVLDAKTGKDTTRLVPEQTANIGATWQPIDALQFMADIRYVGEREDGSNPIPSYNVVDASAKFNVNNDMSLTLKVDNLFDEVYTASTIDYYDAVWLVGKPRTVSITIDYGF